jgi:hypothetical protein
MLMQGLLVWEYNGAPDLYTAQFPPMLINPAHTLSQEKGDILRYHYHRGPFIVNNWVMVCHHRISREYFFHDVTGCVIPEKMHKIYEKLFTYIY